MIDFPDPELLATSRLRQAFPDIYVGRTVPSPTRDEMVTVSRNGGPRRNRFVESVRLSVNVYAATDARANALASAVRSTFETLTDRPVTKVSTEGISEVPNNTTLSQRYFIVYMDIRGEQKEK